MKVSICGDLCPTDTNETLFENGDSDRIFTDVKSVLEKSDFSIANLECPLTNTSQRSFKSGPNNKAIKESILGIANANFNMLSLANNHIKDFGEEGILDTIEACKDYDIKTVGAGINEDDAKKPIVINKDGVRVGILAFADDEGSLASKEEAGANGFHEIDSLVDIYNLKKECDKVVVLYHSGLEHYPYPSPRLQSICRKMVDFGADLITCQHSHCIGSYETYNSATIVYGQGNFLFSKETKRNDKKWNEGLLISLIVDKDTFNIEFIPTITIGNSVRLANEEERTKIISSLDLASQKIQDESFIIKQFELEAEKSISKYFSIILGMPRYIYIFNKLTKNKFLRLFYTNSKAMVLLNIIRCESHREMLVTSIRKYIFEDKE